MSELTWTDLDRKAVDTARILAADAVEKVGNGHPGTAISLAPIAYLLYQKVMNGDPADERWLGRDRFVLSAGHSSMTQARRNTTSISCCRRSSCETSGMYCMAICVKPGRFFSKIVLSLWKTCYGEEAKGFVLHLISCIWAV